MGVMRLKKKIQLNYRRGGPGCWCAECREFVSNFGVQGIGNAGLLRVEPRCRVIGLQNSRRYKVTEIHTCDAFSRGDAQESTPHCLPVHPDAESQM